MKNFGALKRIFLAVLCYLLVSALSDSAGSASERILYQTESLYQYIAVIEDTTKRERYIVNNKRGYEQGGIGIAAPEKLLFEYTQMSFVGLAFLDREPKEALFVGLGAGSMPRYFHRFYPEAYSDVVEIDPDIVSVAKNYFYFREKENMKVHVADGRVFVKRTPRKYDIIFLDAYQTDFIPFHLTTVEFLREIKSKLNEGGVVVSNILSPTKNKFFYSMIRTYREAFPHLYIFKGTRSNNYIFVTARSKARKAEEYIWKEARKIQSYRKMDIDLYQISQSYAYYTEYERKAELLTDDFAPVNIYRHMEIKE
jgi:spermidine synthase